MKKLLLFAGLLHLLVYTANAQYTKTTNKHAGEIKNRTLLVCLREPNPKITAKLKKNPSELEEYHSDIAGENKVLQQAIQNYWTLGNPIQVESFTKAYSLVEKNPEKYALIRFGTYTEWTRISTGTGMNGGRAGWSGSGPNVVYNPSTRTSVATNQISILTVELDGKQAAKVSCRPFILLKEMPFMPFSNSNM